MKALKKARGFFNSFYNENDIGSMEVEDICTCVNDLKEYYEHALLEQKRNIIREVTEQYCDDCTDNVSCNNRNHPDIYSSDVENCKIRKIIEIINEVN